MGFLKSNWFASDLYTWLLCWLCVLAAEQRSSQRWIGMGVGENILFSHVTMRMSDSSLCLTVLGYRVWQPLRQLPITFKCSTWLSKGPVLWSQLIQDATPSGWCSGIPNINFLLLLKLSFHAVQLLELLWRAHAVFETVQCYISKCLSCLCDTQQITVPRTAMS